MKRSRLVVAAAVSLMLSLGCEGEVADSPTQPEIAPPAGSPTSSSGDLTPSRENAVRLAQQGPDVGVLAYCTDLTGRFGAENAANTLEADGRFGSVTVVDADVEQPTAAEMEAQFDCVLAVTDNRCGGIAPGSASLADYAQAGGGVVLATFGFSTSIGFEDPVFDPGVSPFTRVQAGNGTAGTVDVAGASSTPPCDDIFSGVGPFSSTFNNVVNVAAGSTLCASYDAGEEFLAVNATGNVVGFNSFPFRAPEHMDPDYQQVLGNAVAQTCQVSTIGPGDGGDDVVDGPADTCNGQTATPGVQRFSFLTVNFFLGTSGDDVIIGTDRRDVVLGRGGNDTVCTNGGQDAVVTAAGDDWVDLGSGDDTAGTREGADMIFGQAGNDRVDCGHTGDPNSPDVDSDSFDGGSGDDTGTLCEVETNVEN